MHMRVDISMLCEAQKRNKRKTSTQAREDAIRRDR